MKFHKIYDDAQKEIERLNIDNSKKTINNNFKLFINSMFINSLKHFTDMKNSKMKTMENQLIFEEPPRKSNSIFIMVI